MAWIAYKQSKQSYEDKAYDQKLFNRVKTFLFHALGFRLEPIAELHLRGTFPC